jgi:hypothetical protein
MALDLSHFRTRRRVLPAVLAGALLVPTVIAVGSLPAASASPTSSNTRLLAVTLTGSATPTLRAIVSAQIPGAPIPTGTVTFSIVGSSPVQCDDLTTNTIPTTGGVATCKITAGLPDGAVGASETALATYSGDGAHTASAGTYTSSDGTFTPGGSDPHASGDMVPPPGYSNDQLIFDDQFTGTSLDSSKWTTSLGAQGIVWNNNGSLPAPYSGPNVPGDNREAAMFAPSQVTVDNGLTLTAQHNTNQYSASYPWISGVVTTEGKFSLPADGWYVQVLAKMPDESQGMWPAIWFLPGTSGGPSNELVGAEGGWSEADPNEVLHSSYVANQGKQQNAYGVDADVSAGYHVYGFEFLPGRSITAFFDGTPEWQVSASNGVTITAEQYEILLELQVASQQTSSWHTVTTSATPPASMDVAEVQAYSASTTSTTSGSTTSTTSTTTTTSTTSTQPATAMSAPPGYSAAQLTLDDTFKNLSNWNEFYGPGTRWDDFGQLPAPWSGGNTPLSTDIAIYNPSQDVLLPGGGVELNTVPYNGTYASMGYEWLSGVLTSKNTLPANGWYVQVRAQMPNTSEGMWPGIWALPSSSAQELDGFEGGWLGTSPNTQGHSDTFAPGGQIQQVWPTPNGLNLTSESNVYGFQYLPGTGMRFFVNGHQVYSSSADLSPEGYYLFLQTQVAGPQTSGYHTTGGTTSASMKIAEVQIYSGTGS